MTDTKEGTTVKIFISHCTADKAIVDRLRTLLFFYGCDSDDVFCSSAAESGISGGKTLYGVLNEKLRECDLFILFGTSNYLRSVYCVYEVSVARYLGKKVLPLVYDDVAYAELVKIVGNEIVFVRMGEEDAHAKLRKVLSETFGAKEGEMEECLRFASCRQASEKLPFLGSGHAYADIVEYCETFGIVRFRNSVLDARDLKKALSSARSVKILSTTGASLISLLSNETFPELLAAGAEIHVLLADKGSQFCRDVARIETASNFRENLQRITAEFDTVVLALKESIERARTRNPAGELGKVFIGSFGTALRQTILLAERRDGSGWGWISMTVPPYRTKDGTPSFEIECENVSSRTPSMFSIMNGHFSAIEEKAEEDGVLVRVMKETQLQSFGGENKEAAFSYWRNKYAEADRYMKDCEDEEGVLIEIAAQHPLRDGARPGKEFCKRLDFGAKLYCNLRGDGKCVKIYIPGSRHRYKGKEDSISLSEAGKRYLVENGIPDADIFGDEMNRKYKGEEGVYNSADECFVGAQIFRSEGDFGRMITVCSPVQALKKQLFYIENGILAECFAVPAAKMFHDPVYEALEVIPEILYRDHSWQGAGSVQAKRSREERKPTGGSALS